MININDKSLSGYKFIDLFAGLGGFRLSLESFGAECVYSNEWDKHAQEVYKMNFGETPEGDITQVDEKSIPDHDILCAGFPCQAFSISGKQRGFEDSRGTLFFDVARIVKEKQPKVVFLENVKNFASHDEGRTLEVVKNTMEGLGYTFHHKVLNALHYGVPQKRERIYMVCFRNDLMINDFQYPEPVKLDKYVEHLLLPDEDVVGQIVERTDVHMNNQKAYDYSDKPIRLGIVNKGGQGERIYSPKGIAITLSANGGGAFAKTGGYLVNNKLRKLHPRECARVMGFPDSYQYHPKNSQAYKQFGNSVVIDVLQHVTGQISSALRFNQTDNTMDESGFKHWLTLSGTKPKLISDTICRIKKLERELNLNFSSTYESSHENYIYELFNKKGINELMRELIEGSVVESTLPIGKDSLATYKSSVKKYFEYTKTLT
jgi:DNA (cytosine-5)-methyltransferase 1